MTLLSETATPVRKLILVVDDDEGMRAAIYGMLSLKYCVTLAIDGIDGYEKANGQPRPDLIIADVAMPRLDGIAMVRRIWASDAPHRVPVIFLTGQMSPANLMAGLPPSSFAYLSKPTNPAVLEMKVDRALKGP
ncbi:MAG TPA: response regulator [Polyangiaceae bacterium]|nr:response regulator [Polyangiaceae bacterium]